MDQGETSTVFSPPLDAPRAALCAQSEPCPALARGVARKEPSSFSGDLTRSRSVSRHFSQAVVTSVGHSYGSKAGWEWGEAKKGETERIDGLSALTPSLGQSYWAFGDERRRGARMCGLRAPGRRE